MTSRIIIYSSIEFSVLRYFCSPLYHADVLTRLSSLSSLRVHIHSVWCIPVAIHESLARVEAQYGIMLKSIPGIKNRVSAFVHQPLIGTYPLLGGIQLSNLSLHAWGPGVHIYIYIYNNRSLVFNVPGAVDIFASLCGNLVRSTTD